PRGCCTSRHAWLRVTAGTYWSSAAPLIPPSFPTRRSSDLGALAPALSVGALVVPTVVLGPDGGRWPTARVPGQRPPSGPSTTVGDRKSTRLNSSHVSTSYAVVCLKKKSLEALGDALDLKDRETEGHSRRVTAFTIAIARAMGLTADQIRVIARGAFLHDIGKMAIS